MDPATNSAAVCPFCGCCCAAAALTAGCGLGRMVAHADQDATLPPATIDGRPATLNEAIDRAVAILSAAHYPVVLGLEHLTCEAQRVAVSIADRIGACLDTPAHQAPLFPDIGTVSCTLGEVKNRADVIVFWGGRPELTHPRLAERFALEPPGLFVPDGRNNRTLAVVGESATAEAYTAELFLPLTPGQDFPALWLLRALVQGKPVDPGRGSVAGVPLADWQALAGRLRQCRFGVLFLDSAPPTGARAAEAAYGLAADLNRPTRFYSIALRRPGNGLGAEQVAAWQTGFPGAIGLHRGYPRSFGDEYAAASVLNRGEADAALIVGDPLTELIPAARDCLQRIPIIALSSQVSATSQVAAVVLTSAACASHAPATVFRFDGLALPLRPAIRSSFPDDFRVLSALAQGFRRGVPPA